MSSVEEEYVNPATTYLERFSSEWGLSIESEAFANKLDSLDELSKYRAQFRIPNRGLGGYSKHANPENSDAGVGEGEGKDAVIEGSEEDGIYLCGNSLGLQPKNAQVYLNEEMEKWAACGVEGHFHGKRPWLNIDEFVHQSMAKVVGAKGGDKDGRGSEVAVMNSLTTNMHLLMLSFYKPTATRSKLMIEAGCFPSDLYAVKSQIRLHGFDPAESLILLRPREGERTLRTADVVSRIEEEGDSLALVCMAGLQYYTGQFFDVETITGAGHGVGALVGWDLAHAVGNIALQLHDWNVDFAWWCTYKYLNSGPGGIGGCFVHERHAHLNEDRARLCGWWGHQLDTRFEMDEPEFNPIPGAFGWRLSNPPVLPVVTLQASLELFAEVGMEKLREKSTRLTAYLELLLTRELGTGIVDIITPKDAERRGCQLSLFITGDVKKVQESLVRKGIVADVRKPNVMRVAPTPLYNSYSDVQRFVAVLREVSAP
eukprot:TRINITY_DN15772_c0_g1_i1.p1 TRINITY_DN15772_c0_g1~~TRINITY_DN15772_c0_g1_i1.p1  ORF type:complete len:513 (+),score=63.12 TRINITY_DN15772_c0_g1_i1:85-1539(+)